MNCNILVRNVQDACTPCKIAYLRKVTKLSIKEMKHVMQELRLRKEAR